MEKMKLAQSIINTSLSAETQWQSAMSLLNHYTHSHNRSEGAWGDSRQKYLTLVSQEADSGPVIPTLRYVAHLDISS